MRRGAIAQRLFTRAVVGLAATTGAMPIRTPLRFYSDPAKPGQPDIHPIGGDVTNDPDSHPDFQPKPNVTNVGKEEQDLIKKDIAETIANEDVVVFMKGIPDAPVCGFSRQLIDILDQLGLEYTSFDVLAHPVVRAYVKEVSGWPTIPQLFIKGEFAGGTDVILNLAADGTLQTLLEDNKIPHRPGKIKRRG